MCNKAYALCIHLRSSVSSIPSTLSTKLFRKVNDEMHGCNWNKQIDFTYSACLWSAWNDNLQLVFYLIVIVFVNISEILIFLLGFFFRVFLVGATIKISFDFIIKTLNIFRKFQFSNFQENIPTRKYRIARDSAE